MDDIDDSAPADISYVYSGYAPLSIRLVQCVTQKSTVLTPPEDSKPTPALPISGWRGFEDVLSNIPGATVDTKQRAPAYLRASKDASTRGTGSKTTVVFFLGGCTHTEVSALRWMSKRETGRRYLIATTGMVNGTTVRYDADRDRS